MNRIPFTLPDVGLRELRGMVYIDEGFLVLRLKDALLGILDEEKRRIEIEPGALEELRVEWRLFKDRLILQPRSTTLLDTIPGEHRVAVELRVWRKYRVDLMQLVEEYKALV